MIETVFFDIDDTLVNHSGAERKAVQGIRQSFFPHIDPLSFEATWLEKTRVNWELYRKGEISFAQQRVRRIQNVWGSFGKTIDSQEAEENFRLYLVAYEANWELFPDVREVLEELQKRVIRLGVISNGNSDQQTRKLVATGITSYFQSNLILISEAVGISKPDSAIFLRAQNITGKESSSLLYIGDDLRIDIAPPRALRWNAALIDRFGKYISVVVPEDYIRLVDLRDIFQSDLLKTT